MDKAVNGSRLRSVVLGAALGAACGMAQANPTGPTVVNGQVRFSGGAGVLNIHNSPSAIINWQDFSIRQGEITRFLQQNANSAVLNRVIGQNPSDILGSVLSNGRVFVVNPNGILFGRNAVVDTQGLIASTLNINNADFLAGKYEFAAAAGAGAIRNQGFIRSGPGGEVVLIAPSIENSGIIQADDGDLVLAAGRKVTLTSLDAAGVSFDVQAPEDSVLNLGQLIARRGTIGAFAGTLRNTGRMEAGGLAADAAGNIVLMAKADLALEAGSVLDVSGEDGGAVRIESESGSATVDGVVEARGVSGRGGQVDISGAEVVLKGAVDASGERGGGTARVGGGYRGEGELRTATRTEMTEQASIDVSARGEGDGGLAVVWADGTAAVRGSGNIAARGGVRGGDGGTIETSGKQQLSVGGAPDASAAAGDGGLWLLDPLDVVIEIGGTDPPDPPGGSSINAQSVVDALKGGTNVTVTTDVAGAEAGDLTVASGLGTIDMGGQTAALDLVANRDVIVAPGSGGIGAFNGDLALSMNAGAGAKIDIQADVAPSGAGDLQLNAPGGSIYIRNGATVSVDAASASSQGSLVVGFQDVGTLDIKNTGAVWQHSGTLSAGFGAGGSGNINITGGAELRITGSNPGIVLGEDPGADGSMTVTGSGTRVEMILGAPFIEVGREGTGSLTLGDSAELVLQGPGAGIDVGQVNGGVGTLTVEGGAKLEINVGAPFNMQESYFNIARDPGSQGDVVIRDLDSLVNIEGTNAADGSGVVVNVGRGGVGTLSVSNEAKMQISAPDAAPFPGMNIGGSSASAGNGSVTVDADANLEITGNTSFLSVGRNGTGELIISNDGRVDDPTFVTVGRDPLSSGTITMSSFGLLRLRGTASAEAAALEPAVSEGDGAALVVGRQGVGVLDMQSGADVVINGAPTIPGGAPIVSPAGLFVGRLAGGDGSVSIADSNLTVIGPMQQAVIGDQGTALLELLGGSVTLSGSVTVGAQAGSDGVLSLLAGGQLDAPDVINGGTVQGTGVITGNLLAAPGLPNTVAPGASAGKLRVDGDFTASSQTVLSIELGGTNDLVPQYDILDVGGVATLEGQIEVSLIDDFTSGYAPSIGDLFTIVRAGTAVQDQGVTLVLVPPASGLVPLFSLLDLTLEAVVASATGLWTGDGDGTTWGDPLNWEGDLLPGSGDDVLFPELAGQTVIDFDVADTFILSLTMVGNDILEVNGGLLFISDTALADTVVVNGGSLVASLDVSTLQLNGGTLEQGPLPIAAGEFEWNGGDVQEETGIVADVFKLDTSGSRSLDGFITVNSSGVWGSGSGRVTVNGVGASRPTITASAAAAVDIVGNLTLAALDVNNDGLLDKVGGSGSGDIDADLIMSGPSVLSPGLSIGDLSIPGALALSASTRVVIDVDGTSPGAFDTVTAGTVDLTSGPALEVAGTFVPASPQTVTPILCTAGAGCLTGTFGAVDLVSSTIPSVTELYQPDSVDLLLTSAGANLWIGGQDLLWTTPDNWSQDAVPDSGSQVEISSALGSITNQGALFKLGGGTTHVEVPVTTSTGLNVTTGTLALRRDSLLGGNLNTGSDALLAITGGSHQLADGTAFGGAGTVRLNDTQLRVNGDLSNAADLRIAGSTIEATGALDNTGSVRLGDGVVLNMSSFSNRAGAELLKVGGAGESILGMPLNSAGDVGVESGTLTLAALNQGGGDTRVASGATLAVDDGLMLQGGTLGGDGLIDGNVFNGGGVLSAGASPGTLFIDGNYVQGSDGELLVELAGRAPGEYDVLSVSGTASLDGTLSVRFDLPVFPGVIGDRFQILFATALELNGGPLGFANLDAQDGYEFDPDQAVLSNGFQLVVSGVPLGGPMAPSPGPSPDELPLDELLAQALGEEAINQVLATSDADGVDEEDALLAQLDEGDDGAGEVAVGICQ